MCISVILRHRRTSKTTFNNDQQGKKVLGKTGLNQLGGRGGWGGWVDWGGWVN